VVFGFLTETRLEPKKKISRPRTPKDASSRLVFSEVHLAELSFLSKALKN